MVGGAATIFKRKDINIEVGLHEMDFGEYGYDVKHDLIKSIKYYIPYHIELIK